VYIKPLDTSYDFAAVFNLIFLLPTNWGRAATRKLTVVLLGRAMVCSHRLSIQTTVVSDTVWPQFMMQVLTRCCEPEFGGRAGHRGLEMCPLRVTV